MAKSTSRSSLVDDHPARKAGLRQMANARILNSGVVQNIPGRRALFPTGGLVTRIEKFTISSGNDFKIGFGAGRVQISNSVGTVVASFTNKGSGAALYRGPRRPTSTRQDTR